MNTPVGRIVVKDKKDSAYPGCWIGLDNEQHIVCMVEYDHTKAQLQVVVYADGNRDDPTHIIPVTLPTDTD